METPYITDKKFEKIDFTVKPLLKGDYEACSFINCNFSSADLSGFHFSDCLFNQCNLDLVNLVKTTFSDVVFTYCKMTGLHFETCNQIPFTVSFDHCSLTLSSFYRMKIKKIKFVHTVLHETDFTESDLSSAVFDHCDMKAAIFDNSVLEKADFSTAFHYSIDLEKNKVAKAIFSLEGLPGLLEKFDICIKE